MSSPYVPTPGTADELSAHAKAETASLGDIVGDISSGLSTLMQQEVALAKAEARQSAAQAGKAAGLFSGAALGGWMAALFLSLALWEGLSGLMDNRAWAALIVMAIWAIIAAVLASMGRADLKRVGGMPRTVETTKRLPDALKGQETP